MKKRVESQATNRQRLLFLLDVLAEPFPDHAKKQACNCDGRSNNTSQKPLTMASPLMNVVYLSKRDLIETALFEALPKSWRAKDWPETLKKMSDWQLDALLAYIDVTTVDRHLLDLDLFANFGRMTLLTELTTWDKAHKNDTFHKRILMHKRK